MAKTKDELKAMFATGKEPTGADFAELIEGVVGPKGDPGVAGKGTTGANGKDGFGTETQYNDIIARLEALETSGG
ncbi:hypothetical protein [Solibacillus cecembensis]|uniref:hypothetical protein n=1 Tax=Solibacillus cecembensis TaxID=459347 RepID=UPI003D058711